jgi:integrase
MAILAQCPICKKCQRTSSKRCKCGADLDKAKKSGRVMYWIDYRLPGGKQRREPVGISIEDARDAEGKRRGQIHENRIFDILPDSKKTFGDLALWFLQNEKIKSLAFFKGLQSHIKLFNEIFGNKQIGQLTREELQGFQVSLKSRDYSNSYIDQIVDTARWMVTEALDSEIIGGDCLKPFRKLKGLLRKSANARKRVLSVDEFRRLYDSLPKHLKPVVATGFWTGMRQGEILKLAWDKVDLVKRIIRLKSSDTKEGMPKLVPIAKPLRDILLTLPGRGSEGYVFTYASKPMKDITQGIEAACVTAGIVYGRFQSGGFIFHDLRHGFATYARKAGAARNVIMAIMGHSGGRGDMNRRYDLVDESDLLKAVDQIEVFLGIVDQNVDQANETEI